MKTSTQLKALIRNLSRDKDIKARLCQKLSDFHLSSFIFQLFQGFKDCHHCVYSRFLTTRDGSNVTIMRVTLEAVPVVIP